MKDKVEAVLEECFSVNYAITGGGTYSTWYKQVAHAQQKLDALYKEKYLGMLPKEREVIFLEDFKCGGCGICAGCLHYLNSCEKEKNIENMGFNSAIQEIRNRVKESK